MPIVTYAVIIIIEIIETNTILLSINYILSFFKSI